MAAANGDADDGRNRRCQRRTGQAQTHGEHEDIVEHHVEQAAAQGRHHGKGGVAIVADKGRHDVVAHKKRGEQQKNAGVGDAQRHDARIAAHEPQQRPGAKTPASIHGMDASTAHRMALEKYRCPRASFCALAMA